MGDGSLVRLVGWVNLGIMRECFVRGSGLVILSMEWGRSTGLMELSSGGTFIEGKRKVAVFSGQITAPMKATSKRTSFKAGAFLCGKMEGGTKANGRTT